MLLALILFQMKTSLFVAGLVGLVTAWGPDGHRIVAEIAQQLLSPKASQSVTSVLDGSPMSAIATWADEIDHKPEFAWTKCMHYIDASKGVCFVDTNKDCAKGCCVVKAIANYTSRIMDKTEDVADALKFLVHFMGDVHQPLHAGHREDKGGNLIEVMPDFSGQHKRENLHEVWDGVLIKRYLGRNDWKKFALEIVDKIQNGEYNDGDTASCRDAMKGEICALTAALESAENACEFAYINEGGIEIKSGDRLTDQYYESRIVVIAKRLALAGIRLGELLNSIFPEDRELQQAVVETE